MIGVKYTGPLSSISGYGEANRTFVKALDVARVDVTTEFVYFDNNTQNFFGDTYDLAERLRDRKIKYDIKIIHTPCDAYLKYLEPCKYHIGHLFWETSSMSKEWVWNCNVLDEIWTGSDHNKQVFEKAGVTCPIYKFPEVADTSYSTKRFDDFLIRDSTKNQTHKGFLFLSIFQWTERKNPECLVKAYTKAFGKRDKVGLLIKTYRDKGDATERNFFINQIKKWRNKVKTSDYPSIYLQTRFLETDDMYRLYKTCNCFVLPHRGEGWGRPLGEAMIMGKPLISTKLGGIHDWLPDDTYYPLDHKMINVFGMDWAPWYKKEQLWGDVSIAHLAGKMRYVYDNRQEARDTGKRGQDFVTSNFSYKVVGKMMAKRLKQIQRKL